MISARIKKYFVLFLSYISWANMNIFIDTHRYIYGAIAFFVSMGLMYIAFSVYGRRQLHEKAIRKGK